MAEEQDQSKVISKKNAGFPDYLDFDKLRREGIEYLGRLSGKLWTDHNVHDPGITILEMLCYAMLDLGYRTNLPVSDILARHPGVTTPDDNFLTPAQILANNPLTITDYRKLLIDIPGVKNAWLEIVKDFNVEQFCGGDIPGAGNNRGDDGCCIEYVNGLYRVILDLENSLYTDLSKNEYDEKKKTALLEKVTSTLLAHRNFCEDFMTINILCKLEIGVCADIELQENADPEQVYLKMAEVLYQFFSPAPKFYSLPQLLEKGKNIDEIFAGRPTDVKESHGFLDVDELERLPLRKEIHLSDVYNVLLSIPGVKRVQYLRLRKCSGNDLMNIESWKFLMPENHVPEFSVKCSGFRFLRYGVPVAFNFQKYQPLIELNTGQMGKVLFKTPYPYLDSEIPKGNYRADLDQYYSIQNEFPRVYGIGEGGLPDNAPVKRKAQALQLKGYLLFFDQLLANYLSQLKNLRSLFSMSGPAKEEERYSYFINELSTVPDLDKLLRFTAAETDVRGTLLAFPVDRKTLLDKIEAGNEDELSVENIDHYLFGSLDKALIAISQLRDDFYHGNYTTHIISKCDGCVFYYILTSSECFALIGRKYFKNTDEARLASESLNYVAGFEENYRTWITAGDNASFDIEFNLSDYKKYLQRISEEPALYRERRQSFLDHLLARFAERFTDFALLSYDSYTQQQLQDKEIQAKEGYLNAYPGLSANRGKAYNYQQNGWNNENISGFENKFMALSGIRNRTRHSMCNFEVSQYNEKYVFRLNLSDQLYISSDEVFETREEAREGIIKMLQSLQQEKAYDVQPKSEDQKHRIYIEYGPGKKAFIAEPFDNADSAWKAADNLRRMFTTEVADTSVVEDSYKYTPMLKDYDGNPVLQYNLSAGDEGEAKNTALKSIGKTGDLKLWTPAEGREVPPLKLSYDPKANEIIFIDTDVFKKDINNTIVGKPDKYTYELLDRNNSFKFRAVNEFDTEKAAKEDYSRLLHLLVLESNFHVEQNDKGRYRIHIGDGDKIMAESYGDFESEQAARSARAEIRSIINKHLYRVDVDKQPATWKFNYNMGYKAGESFVFKSATAFNSRTEALDAAGAFTRYAADIDLHREGKKISLRSNRANLPLLEFAGDEREAEKVQPRVASLVTVQKDIATLLQRSTAAALDRFIRPDDISQLGLYVYRLIDKDKRYAFSQASGSDEATMKAWRDELIKVKTNSYNALDLYVKGEIINERKGADNKSNWYHYQLRSVNAIKRPDSTSGEAQPLILFESTRGYETRQEAEKAFEENYFKILRLGMDINNFRERKILSSEWLIHNTLPASEQDPVAFVPVETLKFLGEYEEKAWLALIKVIKSYPLRMIYPKADCNEFQQRFNLCEPEPCTDMKNNCGKTKEKPAWYFVLYNKETDVEVWQSEKYYQNASEAWKEYEFFLILLKYHGNYYVDCSCRQVWHPRLNIFTTESVYRVFIREVLAESAGRFGTEAEAWGSGGLQRFINVSQAPTFAKATAGAPVGALAQTGSFHNYLNKKYCCFSFYVACPNTKIYHPCRYDTPGQRDRAAMLLFQSLQKTPVLNFIPECREQASLTLRDFDGKHLATISYTDNDARIDEPSYFGWFTELLQRIATYGLCIEDNQLYLKGKSILFTPAAGSTEEVVKELKERLKWMAQYYPITSKVSGTGANRSKKYCIEIKLPAFNTNTVVDDCAGKSNCWVAWKSDCCYQSCEEIIQAFRQTILLLSRFSNYKPVFDCSCHSYGIAIHYENMLSNDQCGYISETQQTIELPCDNAILAYNPQCYTSAQMACEAVDRAKSLINTEGLHLVEHILLRPHCPEDCDCRLLPCPKEFENCDFPSWKRPTDDPCEDERPVCFKPGHDPYSFIATVVLPAWPKRFRNADNRLLLENIMYREAPAHVLLRIIWLAPHDFCCFEKLYKEWIKSLGLKKSCSAFSLCEFTNFLFRRNYECLGEPRVCEPCTDVETVPNPCVTLRQIPGRSLSERMLSQVNTTYCWLDQACTQYRFVPCGEMIQQPDVIVRELPQVVEAPPAPIAERPAPIADQPSPPVQEKPKKEDSGLDKASKTKFINSRFARYRKETDQVVTETKGAKVAIMARRFLDNNQPTTAEYKKLVEEILMARDDKKSRAITKKRAEILLLMVTQYFIDKWAFNGKEIKHLKQSSAVFEKMRDNKIDMLEIYRKWESDALKKHEPELDMNQVKYLLTGNK